MTIGSWEMNEVRHVAVEQAQTGRPRGRCSLILLLVTLMSIGCDARKRESAALATSLPVVSPPMVPKSPPDAAVAPALPNPEDRAAYPLDLKGQLDRIIALGRVNESRYTPNLDREKLRKVGGAGGDHMLDFVVATLSQEEARKEKPITFAMLKKNADRYGGRAWRLDGVRIVEIKEIGTDTIARLSAGNGLADVLFVYGRFTSDFVEGDRIDVTGFLAGTHTYTARIGEMTVPAMAAVAFYRPGGIAAMDTEIGRENRRHAANSSNRDVAKTK